MLKSNNFFLQTKLYFDKRQKSFSNAKKTWKIMSINQLVKKLKKFLFARI